MSGDVAMGDLGSGANLETLYRIMQQLQLENTRLGEQIRRNEERAKQAQATAAEAHAASEQAARTGASHRQSNSAVADMASKIQRAIASAADGNRVKIRTKEPETFHGERKDVERFITALDLHFRADEKTFQGNDGAKTLYMATLLREGAASWMQPKLRKAKIENTPLPKYDELKKELRTAFGDPNEKATAVRELERLRHKGPITKYTSEFQRITSVLSFGDEALKMSYYGGLSDAVKDEISLRKDLGSVDYSLENLIRDATNLDGQIYARAQERKQRSGYQVPHYASGRATGPASAGDRFIDTSTGTAAGPMMLDATRHGPLDEAERHRRYENRLCYQCGGAGHIAARCTLGSRSPAKRVAFTRAGGLNDPKQGNENPPESSS